MTPTVSDEALRGTKKRQPKTVILSFSEESSNNPAKQDFIVKRLHREAISSLEEGFHYRDSLPEGAGAVGD